MNSTKGRDGITVGDGTAMNLQPKEKMEEQHEIDAVPNVDITHNNTNNNEMNDNSCDMVMMSDSQTLVQKDDNDYHNNNNNNNNNNTMIDHRKEEKEHNHTRIPESSSSSLVVSSTTPTTSININTFTTEVATNNNDTTTSSSTTNIASCSESNMTRIHQTQSNHASVHHVLLEAVTAISAIPTTKPLCNNNNNNNQVPPPFSINHNDSLDNTTSTTTAITNAATMPCSSTKNGELQSSSSSSSSPPAVAEQSTLSTGQSYRKRWKQVPTKRRRLLHQNSKTNNGSSSSSSDSDNDIQQQHQQQRSSKRKRTLTTKALTFLAQEQEKQEEKLKNSSSVQVWTLEEEKLLVEGYARYGHLPGKSKWKYISQHIETKSAVGAYTYFTRNTYRLDPSGSLRTMVNNKIKQENEEQQQQSAIVTKSPLTATTTTTPTNSTTTNSGKRWTPQEVLLLQEALNLYNKDDKDDDTNNKDKWEAIAKHIQTRTPNQAYRHYRQYIRKKGENKNNNISSNTNTPSRPQQQQQQQEYNQGKWTKQEQERLIEALAVFEVENDTQNNEKQQLQPVVVVSPKEPPIQEQPQPKAELKVKHGEQHKQQSQPKPLLEQQEPLSPPSQKTQPQQQEQKEPPQQQTQSQTQLQAKSQQPQLQSKPQSATAPHQSELQEEEQKQPQQASQPQPQPHQDTQMQMQPDLQQQQQQPESESASQHHNQLQLEQEAQTKPQLQSQQEEELHKKEEEEEYSNTQRWIYISRHVGTRSPQQVQEYYDEHQWVLKNAHVCLSKDEKLQIRQTVMQLDNHGSFSVATSSASALKSPVMGKKNEVPSYIFKGYYREGVLNALLDLERPTNSYHVSLPAIKKHMRDHTDKDRKLLTTSLMKGIHALMALGIVTSNLQNKPKNTWFALVPEFRKKLKQPKQTGKGNVCNDKKSNTNTTNPDTSSSGRTISKESWKSGQFKLYKNTNKAEAMALRISLNEVADKKYEKPTYVSNALTIQEAIVLQFDAIYKEKDGVCRIDVFNLAKEVLVYEGYDIDEIEASIPLQWAVLEERHVICGYSLRNGAKNTPLNKYSLTNSFKEKRKAAYTRILHDLQTRSRLKTIKAFEKMQIDMGMRVVKYFPNHGEFEGVVVRVPRGKSTYYLVKYTDGDQEELTLDEARNIRKSHLSRYSIAEGTCLRKNFGTLGDFEGIVIRSPSRKHPWYKVLYKDGDEEDMSLLELEQCVEQWISCHLLKGSLGTKSCS